MIFHEIYGSYFQVVAEILAEAAASGERGRAEGTKLTPARIREIVEEKAFLESSLTIPDALRDGRWPLLRKDGSTPIRHAPERPLSTLEKRWLKAICADPRIQLFDPPVADLDDVTPLFEPDFFVWFDRYADGDPYEDPAYQEHFRMILLALREGRGLRVVFRGKGGMHEKEFAPERLEYSAKDDKFRLAARTGRGTPYLVNLARIQEVRLTERPEAVPGPDPKEKCSVTFLLTDDRNALERVMIHFSDLEKETVRLDEAHYRVTMTYRKDDETEVLIRILSFGPQIRVTAPESFIGLIKDRLNKQKVRTG